jgi:integrase
MRGTLRRKTDDTWQLRIFRGRDEAGRQIFDYHTIHARTKREAESVRTQVLHALDTGGYVEPSRLTVALYLEQWLDDYAAHSLAPKTYDSYCDIVRKHLIPALGDVRLSQLQPARIERYYASELSNGRLNGKGGLSQQSVIYEHRILRCALKRAVRIGLLAANPCDRVDPPKPAKREMRALDETDTERLLAAARLVEPLSLHAAILLAANTGMRRGEVLGLRWADVDLDHGVLHVQRSLQQSRAGVAFKEPKTATSRRMLPLDAETLAELRSYRIRQSERRLALGRGWNDCDLVCPGPFGEPWRPDGLTRAYERFRCQRRTKAGHFTPVENWTPAFRR